MKVIPIVTEDIIKGTRYMRDKFDRLDLLGQILFTGYQLKIINKNTQYDNPPKTPADLKISLHPFTKQIRGSYVNTPLTLQLLENAELYGGSQQLEEANKLLAPFSIQLQRQRD